MVAGKHRVCKASAQLARTTQGTSFRQLELYGVERDVEGGLPQLCPGYVGPGGGNGCQGATAQSHGLGENGGGQG